jgi:peroxiredoxin family protein
MVMVRGRGQASPRASSVVTIGIVTAAELAPPRLAAVISTGDLERLYSGLSVLVSAASDGVPVTGLLAFSALEHVLSPDLSRRAQEPEATPAISWAGRETFARSLGDLRDTALELDGLALYACSASVETMGLTAADVEARLEGVMSTPRFLRLAADARLLFV